MNKPKKKGTAFESKLVKYFSRHGLRAERLALSGTQDQGDIAVHLNDGSVIVVEAKSYKSWTRKQQKQWMQQTVKEGENYVIKHPEAELSNCVLVIDQYNKTIHECIVCVSKTHMMYLDDFIQSIA